MGKIKYIYIYEAKNKAWEGELKPQLRLVKLMTDGILIIFPELHTASSVGRF